MPDDEPSRRAAPGSLLEAVRAAVARHGLLAPEDRVLVAVSGGPDSVALLHALVELRAPFRLDLTVCHVHHGLRPEADRDAAFVEALAKRLGCPVRVVRVDVPQGGGRSPEEAARDARHAALRRVAREIGAQRIALGHTASDQAETVLMRVLQGAGPRGLGGIPMRRGRLVRPLLEVDRGAVEAYLARHGLAAVTDATNQDPRYFRNRVRHAVLPALVAQVGPGVPAALRRLARASREAVDALEALVRPRLAGYVAAAPVGWRVALVALDGLPPGALKTALRLVIVERAEGPPLQSGLRAAHLDALAALVGARPGARVRLPGDVVVERGRDALWLLGPPDRSLPARLVVPGAVPIGPVRVTAHLASAPVAPAAGAPCAAWFDADHLSLGGREPALVVRTARPAERITPFGGAAPVRIRPLLARAGIPPLARARWPVVAGLEPAAGHAVLWLPGVRRAAVAPVTEATRSVLGLRVEPTGCDEAVGSTPRR